MKTIYSRADFSRRTFLRTLIFSSAAALAAGRAETSEGRKLGIALLGLGKYSTGHLAPALLQTRHCRLAGAVSGSPEKLSSIARTYGLPQRNLYNYETFERIADNPAIDIVYVVTPPATHAEFVVRAAKAGKHVISEKPMATSVADCDVMIEACRAARVKLSVGYRLHFDPYHQELMRLQRDGDFGPFTQMKGDDSWLMPDKRTWRIDKKLAGGGPLMDVGIYVVHAACLATGAAPIAVTAREGPKTRPDFFNDVEEAISWTMEFPHGAICRGTTSYNYNVCQFRAEGPHGWFELPKNAFQYDHLSCVTSRGPLVFPPVNQQARQMDDFAACILTGRETSVPGELGRRDIRITSAIYEAARTGGRVEI